MGKIFDQEKRLEGTWKNSKWGNQGIIAPVDGDLKMIDLELEKKMTKLEHENKLMKNALYELSRMENNDYATWVIKVLFGGAPHGAK
ncbi:hypothetical protein [Bacillus phage phi29]|uniref:DNA replication protein 1 n=3 Tax=Salasvirus TaxID=186846 RepID=GP1_BPPH2|nr:hypothetical protein phi29_gp1 [Bacillus phage phi29]YP_009910330.1 hypothetical protein H3014_gp24 [Bacillus phage vB_BveP-Goe6]P03679.2 RecName: Full=DNA replication protein 1; AltName: Full=Gene product 1; Short=gp1 [Bacillus phage phi29]AAB59294.1 protein p1 [Bacillus phage phi29]ACE96022.1 hypothetical protein [Bacillus phage phi29]ASR76789.1 hypothetical protein Goe6_c00040 [Bacillus phage vB_BveP-Goe6]CAA24478.1 unnamed protein product [Bacillus phage phi29]